MTWANKTFSRGQVTLSSSDPRAEPRVAFALGLDARDVARLKKGMRKIAELYRRPALAAIVTDPFPASYSERIRDLGQINKKNLLLTGLVAFIMETSPRIPSRIVRSVITEGATQQRILADDEVMEEFVRTKVHGIWHAAGICRMGSQSDRMAVCDAKGLIGVDGLSVGDTSLMPDVPRANTNKPVIMLAERIADLMRARP